jgi:hypothetical protein
LHNEEVHGLYSAENLIVEDKGMEKEIGERGSTHKREEKNIPIDCMKRSLS